MATKKKSWRADTKQTLPDYRDPETYRKAQDKTRTLSMTAITAMRLLPGRYADPMFDEFEKIRGGNQSDAGNFGILDHYDDKSGEIGLPVKMLGDAEKQWFRDVAKFARRMANALLDKPLDADPSSNVSELNQLFAKGEREKMGLVLELQMAAVAIEQAFPTQKRERS